MHTMTHAVIADTGPGLGHNEPPLSEVLPEETRELSARAAMLIEQAEKSVVKDEETAQKTTLLAGMIRDHISDIDKAREVRKKPYWDAGKMVDAHFNGIAGTLATSDNRNKVIAGPLFKVMGLLDEHRRQKELAAEA